MNNNTPEYYGYTIGQNIGPYINRCIAETNECILSEGVHILGRNDSDFNSGHVWTDNCITWGWGERKDNVRIIGAGYDKTTIKFIDNVQSRYLFNASVDYVLMLQTNYNQSCNNTYIEGITWDGNYTNNNSSSTIFGIRIRGENTTITKCKFVDFGVGASQKIECFQLALGPIDKSKKGPNVTYNMFEKLGSKQNSPAGFVPENTLMAVSGVNTVIKGNVFNDCIFDRKIQQSPVHAIMLGGVTDSIITENVFNNVQGTCIYTDTWTNTGVTITKNIANNVWLFLNLSCNYYDDGNQISYNKDYDVYDNDVKLSIGETTYQWDAQSYPSCFVGYTYDPRVNTSKYPAFDNIVISENNVKLGYFGNTESGKLQCFYGISVPPTKIKLENNNKFTSQLPVAPKKLNWFQKLLKLIVLYIR